MFEAPVGGIADAANILMIGFEDGTLHVSIYDLFEVGTLKIPASRGSSSCKPIAYSYSPFSTTHAILTTQADELQVVPLDLRLIHDAGRYMSLLASRSTQLQHLLRYLRQVQQQIYSDFNSSQSLPSRFIDVIEDDLKDRHDCTFEQAAYHLILTGNCFPELKEWLVDQVGERVSGRQQSGPLTG